MEKDGSHGLTATPASAKVLPVYLFLYLSFFNELLIF